MDIQKKLADLITGAADKAQAVETAVVNEVKKVEQLVIGEVKSAFDKAHEDAVAANNEVNSLKDALQAALAKAANLHQAAVDAANAAKAAAEADVAKYAALSAAHASDLATQQSQIVAPAPAPVDAPAPAPADPAPVTAADLSGNGVTATVTPAQ